MTIREIKPGDNVLITGIGGGVALISLLFGVHAGANVFVTSSSEEKLAKAAELGASGGVNYRTDASWQKTLLQMLPTEKYLNVIIDGAGGEENWKAFSRLIGHGGIIVSYGATAGTSVPILLPMIFLKQVFIGLSPNWEIL